MNRNPFHYICVCNEIIYTLYIYCISYLLLNAIPENNEQLTHGFCRSGMCVQLNWAPWTQGLSRVCGQCVSKGYCGLNWRLDSSRVYLEFMHLVVRRIKVLVGFFFLEGISSLLVCARGSLSSVHVDLYIGQLIAWQLASSEQESKQALRMEISLFVT